MKTILNEQEEIRRFLLGGLAEDERAALEDRFLSDAEIFEQIEDAENDLVDDYVANRLRKTEHARFENYYLALPENRAKVAAARVLRNAREDSQTELIAAPASFWQSIQNFFASFSLAPAMAAATVLLFAVGGLWFAFRNQQTAEIAQAPTPQPTIEIAPPRANENMTENPVNLNLNGARPTPTAQPKTNASPKETPRAVEPKPQPTPAPPAQQTVTLALVTGLVRGEGAANKLILPKNAGRVLLAFDLQAKNYRQIEARIETVAGAQVWRGKIRQTAGRAALDLPAALFADEDYLLIISGVKDAGEREDFQNFYFNAERK